MSEVSQLNIIRESNAHLRSENESLSQKMDSLTAQLRSAVNASSPLEEMIRKLRAEKESVEAVNTQLNVDVNYWRNRLQTLVSRYNDVDPEEHRLLKKNAEELTAALSSVQQSLEQQSKLLEETTQAHQLLLVSKDKEIDGLKNQVSLIEETGERFTGDSRKKVIDFSII
jgi:nucleoprotein TPR